VIHICALSGRVILTIGAIQVHFLSFPFVTVLKRMSSFAKDARLRKIFFYSCYLNEMCTPVSTVPYLSALRSAAHGDLVVPRTRLQLGNRAFCVAGPVAWNSLPLDIRSAPTLSTFKVMLKTHLFSQSYFSD